MNQVQKFKINNKNINLNIMITKINEFNKIKKTTALPINEETTTVAPNTHKITMTFEVKALDDINESKSNINKSILEMISTDTIEIENLSIIIDNEQVDEGVKAFVSNLMFNDKKAGEILTTNLPRYINLVISKKITKFTDDNDKTIDLSDLTKEDLEKAYELGKAAKFYTGDIKFENDKQKRAWQYLKHSAEKAMRFASSGPINPAS